MWLTILIFVMKLVLLILALVMGLALFLSLLAKAKLNAKTEQIQAKSLLDEYNQRYLSLLKSIRSKKVFQAEEQLLRKAKKDRLKKVDISQQQRLYVLDFEGDIKASATEALAQSITTLLAVAGKNDVILVRLTSTGGMVPHYGLAAAQLARVKAAGIKLMVSVDKFAASGGYLMAVVADEILAAPFAIIGSVGVVVQLPNIHRWLKEKGIDVEQHTAGIYKRTLTVIGENTEEGRQKMKEELALTHEQFQRFIHQYRPQVDLEKVATGEVWLAEQAMQLGLVDRLITSQDFIAGAIQNQQFTDVIAITFKMPKAKGLKKWFSVAEAWANSAK